jgi:outer membrane protein OmpA-like peptidoglycan-associated protein
MTDVLASSSDSHRSTRVAERRWVRCADPVWPFVWRGLLPLIGFLVLAWYALGPFARMDIEAEALAQTRALLDAKGHQWAELEVSGQHVVLSGTPPAAGAGEAVLDLARGATCPTWAGLKLCAVSVEGRFDPPKPAAPTAQSTAPAAPATPTALPEAPAAPAAPAAPPAVAEAAAAQACENSFANIVAGRTIEFATGSAMIASDSDSVLNALAKAAATCPGVVQVEGHTDNIGTPEANRALSEARAKAVVAALQARGMPAERLRPQGFGPEHPVADNATDEGRARNRRIEFRVIMNNP